MFGRKAGEILRLENENAALADALEKSRAVYEEIEPFVPLARDIGERVDRRMSEIDVDDIEAAYDSILKGLEAEQIQERIEATVGALPVEKLLGVYATAIGDESVLEPLKTIAARKHADLMKGQRSDLVGEQARESHYFDVSHVLIGEILEVRLTSPENAPTHFIHANTDRHFKLRKHSEDNDFLVLKDGSYNNTLHHYESDTPTIPLNTLMHIGTLLTTADNSHQLNNQINFRTPLGLQSNGGEPYSTTMLVHELKLDDKIVLNHDMCQ